jgi:hypothetical protein
MKKLVTVDDLVKKSLLTYPMLYKNRWGVFHQLFSVNGNGYDWVNGCLTNIYSEHFITNVERAKKRVIEKGVERIKRLLSLIFEDEDFIDPELDILSAKFIADTDIKINQEKVKQHKENKVPFVVESVIRTIKEISEG